MFIFWSLTRAEEEKEGRGRETGVLRGGDDMFRGSEGEEMGLR